MVGRAPLLLLAALAVAQAFPLHSRLPRAQQTRASLHRHSSAQRVVALRGGASLASVSDKLLASPHSLFNGVFAALVISAALLKLSPSGSKQTSSDEPADAKPAHTLSLQRRFLAVFWMLRMSDWLQGPYFYEVYASKVINGQAVSLDMVSKLFLVGFASTGLFGPWVGRQVDTRGRKLGTLVFALLYTVGALSTRSSLLPLLLLGRVAGGVGTSLLFSAPEAWLVGEHAKGGASGKWLGQTFGWAYAGDSVRVIRPVPLTCLSVRRWWRY